jgi:preprotein translocase subunit SecF
MRILANTKIDFMKYRKYWIVFSFAVMALGLVSIFFMKRLNLGIDFAGGTQLTLKFAQAPDVQELRSLLASAGFDESQIQRFGRPGENEILVRTPIVEGSEEGGGAEVLAALDRKFNPGLSGVDLNRIGSGTLADQLARANPDGVAGDESAVRAHYQAIADSVLSARRGKAMFQSWEELAGTPGLSAKALDHLKSSASFGGYAVLATENVGPQVGAELRQRGLLAVVGALLGMLVYIWIRFELRFGIGATMASLHDVLITLGLYSLMGYEFNLTTIAAFLTLVGYSVNDTVVTFDRVRENMRKHAGGGLLKVLNDSINQMLSRTLLTGGTTVLAGLMLFLFGGDVIKGFAFIMMVGILVGTYSSIYIASPFALLWEKWFGARGKAEAKNAAGAKRRASAAAAPGSR